MVKIRKYKKTDENNVKKLINKCLIEIFGKPHPEDKWEDFNDYEVNGGKFFLVEDNNAIIGTIAVINKGDYGILKRMYIKKEYRGKGIAKLLLDKIIKFSKNRFKRIELTTTRQMKRALSFYKKNGFKIIKKSPNSIKFSRELKHGTPKH